MTAPHWMRLAMPDDVAQIIAIVMWQYRTPAQRRAALWYELRELRRTQWDREPQRKTRHPRILRPSKIAQATGYRTDRARHVVARAKVAPETRQENARKGWEALWSARSV